MKKIKSKFFEHISDIPTYYYIEDIDRIKLIRNKDTFYKLQFRLVYTNQMISNIVVNFKEVLGYNISVNREQLKYKEVEKIYHYIENILVEQFISLAKYYDLVNFLHILFIPNKLGKTIYNRYDYFRGYSFYTALKRF